MQFVQFLCCSMDFHEFDNFFSSTFNTDGLQSILKQPTELSLYPDLQPISETADLLDQEKMVTFSQADRLAMFTPATPQKPSTAPAHGSRENLSFLRQMTAPGGSRYLIILYNLF